MNGIAPVLTAAAALTVGGGAVAQGITLQYPSFEAPDVLDPSNPFAGNGVSPFPLGWVKHGPVSQSLGIQADSGIFYNFPASGYPPVGNADGVNLAYLVENAAADGITEDLVGLSQQTSHSLQASSTYAFTIGVGPSVSTAPTANSVVGLQIGTYDNGTTDFIPWATLPLTPDDLNDPDTVLAEDANFPLLKDFTVTFSTAEVIPAVLQNVAVKITILEGDGGSYIFDKASLTRGVLGDFDFDGDIDDSDLGTAFANYTGPLAPGTGGKSALQGDTDNDGDVDDSDLGTAFANYTGPIATTVNVPEPTSLALLVLGGVALTRRRR